LSALTKLFVVLLVICSLMLTAALVIFVNQQDTFLTAFTAAKSTLDQYKRDKNTAQQELTEAKTSANQIAAQAARAATDMQTTIAKLTDDAGKKDVEINKLNARIAVLDAAVSDLTNAAKLGQQNLGDLQKRYEAMVAESDKLRTNNAELNGANTDFEKRLDVAQRELRVLLEQITQLKKENTQARDALAQHNITLDGASDKKVAAPNLKGVIRTVKLSSDGILYATISLGSSDNVEKGMQFNVIDQNAMEFLGKLTVETVEPTQSFGRLEGPRIQNVKPENQVLSQL